MVLTIVGSGTVVPSPDRVCASYYVETGDVRLLLDCGPGALHHMARFDVPWSRLTHVALTHFHNDHVGDLPILFFSLKHGLAEPRREPLTVIGPPGTDELLGQMAEAFGSHLREPGFPVAVREIDGGGALELDATTTLRAHATPHTDASVAFRIEGDDGTLGYTGDTGPSDELGDFMRGVDTLVLECSLPDEIAIPSHLSPASAARLAQRAMPRRLVLTHVYPQLDRAQLPRLLRAQGWGGDVSVAHDGFRFLVARPGTQY